MALPLSPVNLICKIGTQEPEQNDVSLLYRYKRFLKNLNHKSHKCFGSGPQRANSVLSPQLALFLATIPTEAIPPVTLLPREPSEAVSKQLYSGSPEKYR